MADAVASSVDTSTKCIRTLPFADVDLENLAYTRSRHNLQVNDHRQRSLFADWAWERLEENLNSGRKILATKRIFWMNSHVNKQNCRRIWDDSHPHEVQQHPTHSFLFIQFQHLPAFIEKLYIL